MASSSDSSDEETSNSESSSESDHKIVATPWVVSEHSKSKRNTATGSGKNVAGNTFKNDGSFLEMFKKMQEKNAEDGSSLSLNPDKCTEKQDIASSSVNSPSTTRTCSDSDSKPKLDDKITKSINKFVKKRRPARVLPTGLVKKQKKENTGDENKDTAPENRKNDAWSKYLDEVRKYKQQSCTEEEGSRRPLVK